LRVFMLIKYNGNCGNLGSELRSNYLILIMKPFLLRDWRAVSAFYDPGQKKKARHNLAFITGNHLRDNSARRIFLIS
jgi:hypothetical protein